jgi:hypothetical protein
MYSGNLTEAITLNIPSSVRHLLDFIDGSLLMATGCYMDGTFFHPLRVCVMYLRGIDLIDAI